MALIRQHDIAGRDAVVLDLGDLMRQGERIKAAARAEADRTAAAARDERARIVAGAEEEGRKQGHEQGLATGHAEGLAAGRAEAVGEWMPRLEKLGQAWAAALASFEASRQQMVREARTEVVQLAALVAEKVAKRAVALNESAAADQLAAILTLITRPTRLVVTVHPDDEPVVREALPALAARLSPGTDAEFATDATLDRGSCIARTPAGGEIDASIATQIDRIAEALLPGGSGSGGSGSGGPALRAGSSPSSPAPGGGGGGASPPEGASASSSSPAPGGGGGFVASATKTEGAAPPAPSKSPAARKRKKP
ncbi:MAG: hypothetical protein IT437_08265 [Phycisphaerales bacterium]|nr:hypothetical protein [Phycisphaerales bacterium]